MATINKVFMTGRLASDPVYKKSEGTSIERCKITITTEWENKRQDKKEVLFIDCTVWGGEAALCNQYLKKGSVVSVEGRLKTEKWEDKATKMQRSKMVLVADTITFLEKVKMTAQPEAESSYGTPAPQRYPLPQKSEWHNGPALKEPPIDEEYSF